MKFVYAVFNDEDETLDSIWESQAAAKAYMKRETEDTGYEFFINKMELKGGFN